MTITIVKWPFATKVQRFHSSIQTVIVVVSYYTDGFRRGVDICDSVLALIASSTDHLAKCPQSRYWTRQVVYGYHGDCSLQCPVGLERLPWTTESLQVAASCWHQGPVLPGQGLEELRSCGC